MTSTNRISDSQTNAGLRQTEPHRRPLNVVDEAIGKTEQAVPIPVWNADGLFSSEIGFDRLLL